jgi:maltose phosphorylase
MEKKYLMPCFPFSEEYNVYLQQDGFLDKELVRVADLDKSKDQSIKMVLGQNSTFAYIKQADVLQCFYFFEDHFQRRTAE